MESNLSRFQYLEHANKVYYTKIRKWLKDIN